MIISVKAKSKQYKPVQIKLPQSRIEQPKTKRKQSLFRTIEACVSSLYACNWLQMFMTLTALRNVHSK